MNLTKVLKSFFLLKISCLMWAQVANAGLNARFEGHTLPPEAYACSYNQICTGDIVLITMDTDLSPWNKTLIRTSVMAAKDAFDLKKGFVMLRSPGPSFRGFYYWVKPGKTYYFKAIYHYKNKDKTKKGRFFEYFYYKSRGDALNPVESSTEGMISTSVAKEMGLPPIPKCSSMKSPGQFCTNQVVHVFWNNDRGQRKTVLDVDLYINGQFVKQGTGPSYEGNFQDFYYTLPESYSGESLKFGVKWHVLGEESPFSYFENSETLENKYTPSWAFACKPTDSWEKCQYFWQED